MLPKYEYRHATFIMARGFHINECLMSFHRHIEIMYITEGTVNVCIDTKNYTLHENELYIVFPNILHSLRETTMKYYFLQFDNELCPAYHDILTHFKPETPIFRRDSLSPIVTPLFDRMLEVFKSEIPQKQAALAGYVNALIFELIEGAKLVERDSDNDLVQQLTLYLLDNYTRNITLDDAARELNYSKYYISHIISDVFQCNFRPLINSYRVSMAKNLLLSTRKSIGEISCECGFLNQSSFNRIFLQQCGITPTVFRRQLETHEDDPTVDSLNSF